MNPTWTKRLLLVAAAWNILGAATSLADPAAHFQQMYTTSLDLGDPLQRFFYTSVWIAVMAWGAGYLAAAFAAPAARRPVLAAGAAGKLAYFAACVALYLDGTAKGALPVVAGIGDLGIALLFGWALLGSASTQPLLRPRAA